MSTELLQREEMRVESTTANDIAARRREGHFAAAREHGRGKQNGRADFSTELWIKLSGANALRIDGECIPLLPFGGDAGGANELDEGLHIANARDILERYRLLGEQRGGNDRERGVFVA